MRISLEKARQLIDQKIVVAIPTETVYGLAASLKHPTAIQNIFKIKGRPSNNPLIIHLHAIEDIYAFTTTLPEDFLKLAEAFWPGPLTFVLPANLETVPAIVRANLSTAAFRIPNLPLTRQLISQTGPLVMPSANLSGKPSATQAHHVENDFGKDFPVLEGGVCQNGVESTILLYQHNAWMIIRLGAIAPEMFLPVLNYIPKIALDAKNTDDSPLCPGQHYRHYAPQARLHLQLKIDTNYEGVVLGFDNRQYGQKSLLFSLGNLNDEELAIHRLYTLLRKFDEDAIKDVVVDFDIPNEGLWLTLKERLLRASEEKNKDDSFQ